jgi:glycosyltransferase involved in cell wall biosynthesis
MSPKLPKVSVFVPTYNQRRFVREALDSVLAQDYPNLEIVVGDDGSVDGTREILLDYQKEHPQLITLLLSPKNEGITANCNKILERCNGEYLALFAGDDVWLPGKLHRQVELMQGNRQAVVCATRVEWFDSASGRVIRVYPSEDSVETSAMNLLHAASFVVGSGPSLLLRRDAAPKTGFETTLPMVSDWLFLIEVLRRGTFILEDRVLARYRRHEDNTSKNSSVVFREHIQTMNLLRLRHTEMRRDIQDYMEHYLINSVPPILRAPNAASLKLYSVYLVVKYVRLKRLWRILRKRISRLPADV